MATAALSQIMGNYFDFLTSSKQMPIPVVLSPSFMSKLWYLLVSSSEKIFQDALIALLTSLYKEWGMYASVELDGRDIDRTHINSLVWETLYMPVFRTRYGLPVYGKISSLFHVNVIRRISVPQLFERLPNEALQLIKTEMDNAFLISAVGPTLQADMKRDVKIMKDLLAIQSGRGDPISAFIHELTCPLGDLAIAFDEARFSSMDQADLSVIPYAICQSKLDDLSDQVARAAAQ
jgi:hypothetical protein